MTAGRAGQQFATGLERAGRVLARAVLLCGAATLLAMLALTCVDVFGRYILNAPVNGKTEITRLMMAIMVFTALPVVSASGEQITVDLFDRMFSRRGAAIRDALTDGVAAACLFVMVYWLVFRAERLLNYGYVTDFLHIPLYPFAYFVAAMTGATALALTAKVVIDVLQALAPQPEPIPGDRLDRIDTVR